MTPTYVDVADYEVLPPTTQDDKEIVLTDSHYPELGLRFPLSKILPVQECEFEDRKFHCPHESGYVLTQQYGSDWRTPNKYFKSTRVYPSLSAPPSA